MSPAIFELSCAVFFLSLDQLIGGLLVFNLRVESRALKAVAYKPDINK